MFKKLFGKFTKSSDAQPSTSSTYEQRRKTARRPCRIEVDATRQRADFVAHVVDMSVGGVRLHLDTPRALKNRSVIKLAYPEELRGFEVLEVDCITRWTRTRDSDGSQFVGLEFKEPKSLGRSWVKAKMQELGFRPYNIREQRNDVRVPCRLKASVSVGGMALPATIKNIGLGGVFLELAKPVRGGAEIEVKLFDNANFPTTTFLATVRHQQHPDPSAPFGYGVAFKSISLQQAEEIKEFFRHGQESGWETEETEAFEEVEIPSLDSIMDETEEPREE